MGHGGDDRAPHHGPVARPPVAPEPVIEVHLPPAVERLPRHRARLEAACRTAMAQPDIVEMTTSDELTAPLLERHGVEPASRGPGGGPGGPGPRPRLAAARSRVARVASA